MKLSSAFVVASLIVSVSLSTALADPPRASDCERVVTVDFEEPHHRLAKPISIKFLSLYKTPEALSDADKLRDAFDSIGIHDGVETSADQASPEDLSKQLAGQDYVIVDDSEHISNVQQEWGRLRVRGEGPRYLIEADRPPREFTIDRHQYYESLANAILRDQRLIGNVIDDE